MKHSDPRTGIWKALLAMVLIAGLQFSQEHTSAATNSLALPPSALPPNDGFIAIAKLAKASVVNISAARKVELRSEGVPNPFFDDPFFRRFFGEEFERRFPAPRERKEQGLGSGVIVSADGYIVTNNHVVEKADEIRVLLSDKRTVKAKVVGTDPKTDVAVIKVDAASLPTLPWGDSSQLQVGELVLAVGNPFGLNQTVTMGIISAVGRANMGIVDYEDFIQTDAAINPGNSGGALVNMKGELIGINTAIFSQSGGNMGIGFAIPSNMVKTVMTGLIKHGKVVRGWIGVSIQEMTEDLAKEFSVKDTKGALIADVMPDSPAAHAKLERGDVIVAYGGKPVNDPGQLRMLVAETPPGTSVAVTVLRDRQTREVSLTIGELPTEVAKAGRGSTGSGRGEHALAGVTVTVEDPTASDRPGRRSRPRGETGVMVSDVEADSPAERAGLRTGDVIREINRNPVRSVPEFERIVNQLTPKSRVLLLLTRGNATVFLSVNPE